MRRRQRRLRAWARHERVSIAMALATVEHHSYGPTANAGQTTGTSAREGEVREQRYGLFGHRSDLSRGRGQHHCPLGLSRRTDSRRRLESLLECRRWLRQLWRAPAAEGVDTSTLRFLAAAALHSRKLEEEEVRKREEEEKELKRIRNIPLNQLTPIQRQMLASWIEKEKEKKKAKAAIGILPSTSSSSSRFIRKRKKKRKRTRRRC